MSLSSEAVTLCNEFGGFWNFVKSPEFTFYRNHHEAFEEILHEYKEYSFCKALQRDKFFEVDGEAPLWNIKKVKEYLKKKKIEFTRRDSEEKLRGIAYEEAKKELRKNFEDVCYNK